MSGEPPQGVALRFTKLGLPVLRIHYTADPERRTEEWRKQERRKYSSQAAWNREQEIDYVAGGGEPVFAAILSQYWNKIVVDSPEFTVSPFWTFVGGFDHGTSNPTAALLVAIGGDGIIYVLGEYYHPWLEGGRHAHIENLKRLRWRNPETDAALEFERITARRMPNFVELETVYADPSIMYAKTQQQTDGSMRTVGELYHDSGLTNLSPAPNNEEITGMDRILEHWRDLEHREPSLKIVCPKKYTTDQKQYGLFSDGCPNLLWELKRTRREQLSAQQLLTKNLSEKIVDKDNHLRDCLKYLVLALPEPAQLPREEVMRQRIEQLAPRDGSGSATNGMIMRKKLESEALQQMQPIFIGGRAKQKLAAWKAGKKQRHYSNI